MNKKILSGIIIFILAIVGVLIFLNQPESPVPPEQIPINTEPAAREESKAQQADSKTSITSDGSDTSDWKLYRNERHNFEVKYPPHLTADGREDGELNLYKNKHIIIRYTCQ